MDLYLKVYSSNSYIYQTRRMYLMEVENNIMLLVTTCPKGAAMKDNKKIF